MKTSYVMTHEEKLKVLMEANTKLHKPLELIFQDHSKQEILKLWNEFLFSASSGAYENYVNNMQHAVRHLDFFTSYSSLENDQFDQFLDFEYMKRYAIEFFKINGHMSHDAEKLFKHNYNRMNTFYYAVFCYGVHELQKYDFLLLSFTLHVYLLLSEWIIHWPYKELLGIWPQE